MRRLDSAALIYWSTVKCVGFIGRWLLNHGSVVLKGKKSSLLYLFIKLFFFLKFPVIKDKEKMYAKGHPLYIRI